MDLHFKPREGGWSSGRLYYGAEKPDRRLYYGGVPLTYLWRANIFSRAKDRIERIDARLALSPEKPGAARKAHNWYSKERRKALEFRAVSLAKKLTASESDVNVFISNQVKVSDLIPDDGDFLRRLDGACVLYNQRKLALLAGVIGSGFAETAYLAIIIQFQEPIRKFIQWLPSSFQSLVPLFLLAAVIAPGVYVGKLMKGALEKLNMGNINAQELICAARKMAQEGLGF